MKNIRGRGSALAGDEIRPKISEPRAHSTNARSKQAQHNGQTDILGDDRLSANDMDPDVGVNIDHGQRYQVVDGQFGDGYQVSDEMSNLI